MKHHRTATNRLLTSTDAEPRRFTPSVTRILCLGILAALLPACAIAPLIVAGSTTAAALVREVEVAVLKGDTSALVAVDQDAVVYSGPGEQYTAIDTLTQGVECEIVKRDGEWLECRSRRFGDCGWIRASAVQDI